MTLFRARKGSPTGITPNGRPGTTIETTPRRLKKEAGPEERDRRHGGAG
jgi:hypothetical protein